ncbi:MAG: hypothetical protein AAGF25_00555 [Pseudomonadota bacterium]
MTLSDEIKTDIETSKAIADLFDRQKINLQGAAAAASVTAEAQWSDAKKAQHFAELQKFIDADQAWFKRAFEKLANRFGHDRVQRVMRTGIDLSECTTL